MHHVAGYTGNGVGPSQLAGRILAALALDRRDEHTALPLVEPPPDRRVPPEPLRLAGGSVVLAALRRKEAAEERGARPDPRDRIRRRPARPAGDHGRPRRAPEAAALTRAAAAGRAIRSWPRGRGPGC